MDSEVVEFQGVKFRRYPQSERWADSMYFTPGPADRIKGVRRLHEEIWRANNGDIPEGSHIHHVDHNPLNNDPTNLVCMTGAEHHEHHAFSDEAQARVHSPEWLDRLATMRDLAAQWHGSPEGFAWHSEHAKQQWANKLRVSATCEQCGNAFVSKRPMRFCSGVCKSQWRRLSGRDDETRTCPECGASFVVNHYSRQVACSRPCGTKIGHRNRRAAAS